MMRGVGGKGEKQRWLAKRIIDVLYTRYTEKKGGCWTVIVDSRQ
jgi:hypothetical protein